MKSPFWDGARKYDIFYKLFLHFFTFQKMVIEMCYMECLIQSDNFKVAISFSRVLRSCRRERKGWIFNGFSSPF